MVDAFGGIGSLIPMIFVCDMAFWVYLDGLSVDGLSENKPVNIDQFWWEVLQIQN